MAVSKLIFRVDDQAHKIISCESFVSVGEKFDVIIEGGKTENWQGKTVHLTFSQTASMADDVLEVISGIASEMSGSIQIATDAMLKNKRTLNYVSKWGNRGASVRVGLKTDDTDYGATKTKVFSNRANDGTPLPEFQKDVDKHNKDPEAHADIRQAITEGDAGVERRTKEYAQTLVSQERNDRNAEIQRAINEQGISSLPDLVNGAAASAKAAADGALAASKMADAAANSLTESKKVELNVSGMRDSVADTEKRVDSKYESIEALTRSAIDSAMKAGLSAGQAKESESESKKNADSASKSALDATSERGEAIRIANEAKAIAEGSTKAFVFDSEMDMQRFVAKQVALPESQRVVKVGSNLLIKQKGVPDYWWTGVNPWIEELESKGEQKIVVDDVPTMGSNNPVSSNGVYTEFNNAKTGITPLVERAENAATAADASTKASAASEDSAAQSAKSAEASAQTASERATVADNSATAAKKSAESAKTSAESASSEVAKVPAMLAGKQDTLTAANAGDNVTIEDVDGVVKIAATGTRKTWCDGLLYSDVYNGRFAAVKLDDKVAEAWFGSRIGAVTILSDGVGYALRSLKCFVITDKNLNVISKGKALNDSELSSYWLDSYGFGNGLLACTWVGAREYPHDADSGADIIDAKTGKSVAYGAKAVSESDKERIYADKYFNIRVIVLSDGRLLAGGRYILEIVNPADNGGVCLKIVGEVALEAGLTLSGVKDEFALLDYIMSHTEKSPSSKPIQVIRGTRKTPPLWIDDRYTIGSDGKPIVTLRRFHTRSASGLVPVEDFGRGEISETASGWNYYSSIDIGDGFRNVKIDETQTGGAVVTVSSGTSVKWNWNRYLGVVMPHQGYLGYVPNSATFFTATRPMLGTTSDGDFDSSDLVKYAMPCEFSQRYANNSYLYEPKCAYNGDFMPMSARVSSDEYSIFYLGRIFVL